MNEDQAQRYVNQERQMKELQETIRKLSSAAEARPTVGPTTTAGNQADIG